VEANYVESLANR